VTTAHLTSLFLKRKLLTMAADNMLYTDELARAVEQVCSPLYVQLFEKAAKELSGHLSNEENFVLQSCPNKITWYSGDRRQEIIDPFRLTHVKWFINWLSEQNTGRPPYVERNSYMEKLVLHRNNLFFRIDLGDVINSTETRDAFRQIADISKRILLSISESNPVTIDRLVVPLVQEILQILFYFTLDSDLAMYLKSLQLVDLMAVLIRTSNNDNEIHLQAYRILAVIMAEADVKQLKNSSRIAAVFITFIKDTIDGGVRTEGRLHNSLRSLKGKCGFPSLNLQEG
jgi:hypothetical protein